MAYNNLCAKSNSLISMQKKKTKTKLLLKIHFLLFYLFLLMWPCHTDPIINNNFLFVSFSFFFLFITIFYNKYIAIMPERVRGSHLFLKNLYPRLAKRSSFLVSFNFTMGCLSFWSFSPRAKNFNRSTILHILLFK